jgi:hypothetical protein
MLSDILAVNATLVSQAQNDEMKRLTEASYAQNEHAGAALGHRLSTRTRPHGPRVRGLYWVFKHREWL